MEKNNMLHIRVNEEIRTFLFNEADNFKPPISVTAYVNLVIQNHMDELKLSRELEKQDD